MSDFNIYQYSKGPCEFFIIATSREKADELNTKHIGGTYTDETPIKEGLFIQSMSNVPKPAIKE